MKNNASLIYNFCLVIGDFLALVGAFVMAYIFRIKLQLGISPHHLGPVSSVTYLDVFLVVLPFWILIFALLGLYNNGIYENRFKELGRLLLGSFIGMLFVIFWNFVATKPIFPAKLIPIYGFAFGFIFLVIFRNLARFIRSSLFGYEVGLTRVLLVGNTTMTRELLDWLAQSQKSGYKVIGVVGGKASLGEHHETPLYHSFTEFLNGYSGELHGIIQTELYAEESKNARILSYAQEHHVSYRFVPGNSELFVGNIEVELFRSGVPVITVHQTALFGWGRVAKRFTDLLVGGFLLLLAIIPMMIIAVGVKLSDPKGTVFYKPKRLGRFGRTNSIYKFRTMYKAYTNMSPEEGFKKMQRPELIEEYRANGDQLDHDPRVYPFGRFMRRFSLDEVPQLINVVKGELSMVGPRALDAFELEKYEKKNHILVVKSGLTGLAQVSGRREITFEERRKLDLYYVQNWSLWLDIVIMVKTARVVLGGRGTN